MSETKEYIIVFEERKKLYRLIPKTGRVIRVKKDHKKFEWVQQQEPSKVVKINAAGRWTSSKDYNGLYEHIQQESKPVNNQDTKIEFQKDEDLQFLTEIENKYGKVDTDLLADAKTENTEKSILGYHSVELRCNGGKDYENRGDDETLLDVAAFYTTVSSASTPTIMRKFNIGYERAIRIKDALEELSVIKDDHKSLVQSTAEVKQLLDSVNEEIGLGIEVSYDLDNVVKELLDKFISKNEFTKQEMLFFLRLCKTVKHGAELEFSKKHSSQFTDFTVFNAEGFISLLFKLQIIDDGTQRRSIKDTDTYYKFTKHAKKLYKDL